MTKNQNQGMRACWAGPACLAVFVIGALLGASAEGASADGNRDLLSCGRQLAAGVHRYATETVHVLAECEADNAKDNEKTDCPTDPSVLDDLKSRAEKLGRRGKKCKEPVFKALCPFEVRHHSELVPALGTAENGVSHQILDMTNALFRTDFGGSCLRPTTAVSREAAACADGLARTAEEVLDDVLKCTIKCEVGNLIPSRNRGPCLDKATGEPRREKIEVCYDRAIEDISDSLGNRCNDFLLRELGCPMGVTDLPSLTVDLFDAVREITVTATLGAYRSSCRKNLDYGTTEAATPAKATLSPSGRQVEIACGDVLDSDFFAGDTVVAFDSDLDCREIRAEVGGISVAQSGVTISGRSKYRIRGPQKKQYQTQFGIFLMPGIDDVTVKSFRSIERFGIGIGNYLGNQNLRVRDLTVRRNRIAGIGLNAPNSEIDDVRADRNVIGITLTGHGSTIRDSRAERSEPAPGIGIHLRSLDPDGLDAIRITSTEISGNLVGVVIEGGPHFLEESVIRENLGDGVILRARDAKMESNSIKRNGAHGVVVEGDANLLTANHSDENAGAGFVILGSDNLLDNNDAGTLTDRGNAGPGFWILGPGTFLDSNTAEANAGSGFLIEATTLSIASNNAQKNGGAGFDIIAAGNALDSNVAAENVGFEFAIASGNTDVRGNRANGRTISFPETGANIE
ncbi:MAG: right-handed parallel beta-helix repeat-containing protein [Deltaproteobacteria bacterium]